MKTSGSSEWNIDLAYHVMRNEINWMIRGAHAWKCHINHLSPRYIWTTFIKSVLERNEFMSIDMFQ